MFSRTSINTKLVLGFFSFFIPGSLSIASPINTLLEKMTNETAAWDIRNTAENSLMESSPQEVLPKLLPYIDRPLPGPGIWNSGGKEIDKQAPVKWQIFYAVSRVWNHQINALPKNSGGQLLLKLLQKATTENSRIQILNALTHTHWVPEAESYVAAILQSSKEKLSVRTTAARTLIYKGTKNYHDLLLKYVNTGRFAERKQWFDLLADSTHKQQSGIDPRVIQIGFRLIVEDRQQSPDYIHGAYFLSRTIGDYLEKQFAPDQNESRYKGDNGLQESFFVDTVKNALKWWDANKKQIEKNL